jgi:hypothetical protein
VAPRTSQVSSEADLLGDLWSGHQSLVGGRLLLKARICWAAKNISLGLFEPALMLMRFDHVARSVKNPDDGIVRPAAKPSIVNCVADCVWLTIQQSAEWQHIGN